MTITVKQGQTVYDVALIAYGDPSAIYDLAKENPTIDISAIQDLTGKTLFYTQRKKSVQKEAVKNVSPPAKSVTIRADQSIFDLALQYYGKPELAYKLLAENPNIESIFSDNIGGKKLNYTESVEFIPFYLKTNKLIVATRLPSRFETRITEDNQIRALENNQNRIIE